MTIDNETKDQQSSKWSGERGFNKCGKEEDQRSTTTLTTERGERSTIYVATTSTSTINVVVASFSMTNDYWRSMTKEVSTTEEVATLTLGEADQHWERTFWDRVALFFKTCLKRFVLMLTPHPNKTAERAASQAMRRPFWCRLPPRPIFSNHDINIMHNPSLV